MQQAEYTTGRWLERNEMRFCYVARDHMTCVGQVIEAGRYFVGQVLIDNEWSILPHSFADFDVCVMAIAAEMEGRETQRNVLWFWGDDLG